MRLRLKRVGKRRWSRPRLFCSLTNPDIFGYIVQKRLKNPRQYPNNILVARPAPTPTKGAGFALGVHLLGERRLGACLLRKAKENGNDSIVCEAPRK